MLRRLPNSALVICCSAISGAIAAPCATLMKRPNMAKPSQRRTNPPRFNSWALVYRHSHPLPGVLLGDLVVKKRCRIRRRHEAPVDLGVDAAVLEHLAVGHLDFERARVLVVADRAQLGRIDA